uniref:Uncharacterized protein n=1 Tax=Melopsittacus undulatus TaxID=13146 RepID=A0A8V5GYM6_MELUD
AGAGEEAAAVQRWRAWAGVPAGSLLRVWERAPCLHCWHRRGRGLLWGPDQETRPADPQCHAGESPQPSQDSQDLRRTIHNLSLHRSEQREGDRGSWMMPDSPRTFAAGRGPGIERGCWRRVTSWAAACLWCLWSVAAGCLSVLPHLSAVGHS